MHKVRKVIALLLALAGCHGAEPMSLQYEPQKLAQVSVRSFEQAERVDCSSEGPTRLAMVYLGRAGMSPQTEVLRSAVKQVRFADGKGYIAAAELRWRPGDPGKRLKRVDYFIFDEECRAQMWRAGTDEPA